MSFRERFFIDQLYKDAKINLAKIMEKRRHTFWGETPILFRVRKYKVAGQIRDTRVSVVKPQLHKLRLFSKLLGRFVPLEATPQMLRYIEASGGLDDYLLKTPDHKLHSDVASQLKVQLMTLKHDPQAAAAYRTQLEEAAKAAKADGGQGPAEQPEEAKGMAAGQADKAGSEQRAAAAAQVKQARAELEAARKERITRMLEAAAAAAASSTSSRIAMSGTRPRLYS